MKKITLFLTLFFMTFIINAQDTCATATTLTPGVQQCDDTANYGDTFDDNACLGNYDGGNDYLFVYTATATGETLQLDLTSMGTWTGIAISEGCPEGGAGVCFGASTSSSGDESFVSNALNAGMDYYIHISTWPSPQTADFCLDATVIPPPTCFEVTNLSATPLTGDTSADLSWDAEAGATLGYNWAVMNDGEDPDVDTPADSGSTTMTMATATGLTAGNDYDLYVQSNCDTDGLSTWAGPLSFTSTAPPANDNFANATAIDCSAGTIMGSTSAATIDEDDAPDGGGADLDAPNVWYSLDSSVDGASDVTLDLCGSGYDTSVLVYTGTSGNLTFVAANDDNTAACGQCCQSLLTFPTDGTSTYYITVEGYNPGSIGDFEMAVSCIPATPAPGNDDCGNAVALTTGVTVSGTTVGATTSPGDAPTCDTFGSIADVWYSFEITGGESDLSISTTITGTSDEANVALYDDCAALAANSLGCTDDNGNETLDVTNLAVGTYYIRVWSDGNAPPTAGRIEGTFDIVVNATLSTGDFDNPAAFTYYPNPVKNALTLNAQNSIEDVTMYNMLGQVVLRNNPNAINSEIDMSNLQDGAYFVKVTIANVTKTIRVIKQ